MKQFDEMMDDSMVRPMGGIIITTTWRKTPVVRTFTPCPVLDGHLRCRIIGIPPVQLRFRKLKHRWRQEKTVDGHHQLVFPRPNAASSSARSPATPALDGRLVQHRHVTAPVA